MHVGNYTGWDIGGAHLKIACINSDGVLCAAHQFATPLWQGMDTLAAAVTQARARLPAANSIHTLTLTGELADCFPARRDGVIRLIEYLSDRLGKHAPSYVYAGDQGLITPAQAPDYHTHVASANWHATASYAAQSLESGILIDLGTTTTDIVPFAGRQVCSNGYTDQERLRTGELVYTGVTRTPVMAVVRRLPYKNVWQPIAAEYFASMADVYRITGELDEHFDLIPAADGGAKTRCQSMQRLARMLGTEFDRREPTAPWLEVADYIAEQQLATIDQAFDRVRSNLGDAGRNRIVAAGAGRFIIAGLARKNNCEITDFESLLPVSGELSGSVNNCSTAVAVAALTRMYESSRLPRQYVDAPD